MEFLATAYTDVGIQKDINQDSALIKLAETSKGSVCLAIICDGMGGLQQGELASATLIRAFSDWFENELQFNIDDSDFDNIKSRIKTIIIDQNHKISNYANEHNIMMGTTLSVLLIVGTKYLIVHVGDSRIYKITNTIEILTKDQTVVERDLERGLITPEQASKDPRKNVLLQCIGASSFIVPEIKEGIVNLNDIFMLCSDGFIHKISSKEILESLNYQSLHNESTMTENSKKLTELCKQRQETDNITVLIIKTV